MVVHGRIKIVSPRRNQEGIPEVPHNKRVRPEFRSLDLKNFFHDLLAIDCATVYNIHP